MIVAFEGSDKAGKSTLLSEFRKIEPYHRWPLFRMDVPAAVLAEPEGLKIEEISRAWNEGLAVFKKHVSFLLDRCFVSSLVYSRVFGRQVDLSYIDRLARELDPIIVYVRTPVDVLVERLDREGDRMLHDRVRLIAVAEEYERWWMANPTGSRIIVAESGAAPAVIATFVSDACAYKWWKR